jgi:hypothetical protein
VKGNVTFNSNGGDGMFTIQNYLSNPNLEIIVETGATLNSCGNSRYDIGSDVSIATLAFLGDGYTCDKVYISSGGTVVPPNGPNCQACT